MLKKAIAHTIDPPTKNPAGLTTRTPKGKIEIAKKQTKVITKVISPILKRVMFISRMKRRGKTEAFKKPTMSENKRSAPMLGTCSKESISIPGATRSTKKTMRKLMKRLRK